VFYLLTTLPRILQSTGIQYQQQFLQKIGLLDLLALRLQVLLITLKYSAIADLHNFHFTVAHALGFFVYTSRFLATDVNIETRTPNRYEVFLLFRFQSLRNLGTKNSSALTPPAYD
jgi:hypothetical protein